MSRLPLGRQHIAGAKTSAAVTAILCPVILTRLVPAGRGGDVNRERLFDSAVAWWTPRAMPAFDAE